MGRKPQNDGPMSGAERQRQRRARLKAEREEHEARLKREGLHPIYVRGEDGRYDGARRVGKAIHELASKGELPMDVLGLIIDAAVEQKPKPSNLIERKYIKKLVSDFLGVQWKGA